MAEQTTLPTAYPCRVVTPHKTLFEGSIREATVESLGGTIEILPGHEALMTPLVIGVMQIIKEDRRDDNQGVMRFAVHGGFLDMNERELVILAKAAEEADKIDVERAQASMNRAKERLEAVSRASEDEVDIDRAKAALLRSLQRMRATKTE